MSRKVAVLFSLMLFGFVSCAGHQIDYNSDSSYKKKIKKLFVYAELQNKGWYKTRMFDSNEVTLEEQLSRFKKSISGHFNTINVASTCYTATGLELDDTDMKREMKKNPSDAVLVIQFKSGTLLDGELLIAGHYELALFDSESGKCFWRAKMMMSGAGTFDKKPSVAEDLAGQIFKDIQENAKPKDGPGWF